MAHCDLTTASPVIPPDDRDAGVGGPFSATEDLLRAGVLRHEGRPAGALDLVCEARLVLARFLPEGDPTLQTVDRTIGDLRAEVAGR